MELRQRLRVELAGYRPRDAVESAFRERMIGLLANGPFPFCRKQFRPGHFTASALVLAPDGGSLLLIRHPRLGRWLQPGGHVEPSDVSLVRTARREVCEETGLDCLELTGDERLPFDLDVHPIPARPGEPSHSHFDVRYLFRARRAGLPRRAGEHRTRWVALEALRIDSGTDRRRVVDKLLELER